MNEQVTFKDFAGLVDHEGWSVQFLAERFHGKVEDPIEFFGRVLRCKYKGAPDTEHPIPYFSVLGFYFKELARLVATESIQLCACNCKKPIFERKIYYSVDCRDRVRREKAGSLAG